jgi:hypothetical protein
MSLSKLASAFTARSVIVSLAVCLGASAALAESNDHGPWSQMPMCHSPYITGVPCVTSYGNGCWKRNDDDPVEHCGYGQRPIPLGQRVMQH